MAVLDPAHITRFERDGFLVVPDMLDARELDRYGRAVDAAVEQRTASDDRRLEDKTVYEQSFMQCMRLWETDPGVAPLTFHPKLAEAATELLRVPSVLLWQDQALYKEPGGRETTPHQDSPFWPIGEAPLVSAWIPFDGSSVGNGAMAYVPGSHRVGRLRVVDITHTTEPYDVLADPALEGRESQVVEAPAGSVVWHHGMTVHQAFSNRTDRMRRVFTIVYIAKGFRRLKSFPAFPLDRDGVAVGDLIEGPGMPVAWPRSTGDLPQPPRRRGEPTGPQYRTPKD